MTPLPTPPTPPALRAWRITRGLSLNAVADLVGVRTGTVWRWEMGRRRPSRLAAARLREVMTETQTREESP